ncbi:glycosyl hydrolase family 62-domain-containing protein [Hypoxylon trugodes]|uniref:glycosyl hydrolase family 62-domain-containing protein n=1 Tax=Hypoxylon trugodes TaxID=326681 RepID=UPI0021997418|nr:glycosyl hydrolase family 62-domain-containing protein [Hypoxylon trugodes]KAI1384335.1 glycosyl hydrolase family 62-domain-containing protein [Hypoxylon trugodes]
MLAGFFLLLTGFAAALPAHDVSVSGSASKTLTARQSFPSTFKWSSSEALVGPKSDGRNIAGIKDPSIIFYEDKYHVFASTASSPGGYNLVYFSFTDFAEAGNATFHYLDQSPLGKGYRAAPQVFYFEPQSLWYLIYQNNNAAYSTNKDINDPSGWTAPKTFFSNVPSTINKYLSGGYWVDMWVICDAENCHHFSSDDNGHLFRAQTSVSDFPNKMGEPVVALQDSKNALFEASNVYKIGDSEYLLIVEAISSDGARWFRSWTSDSLSRKWTALAATESNPFARSNNVAFTGKTWTKSISHGEMIRDKVDQTMTISPCNLRYLYQGVDPSASGNYNSLPWKLGLLTQTNSAC